jgi:hypothetical protein
VVATNRNCVNIVNDMSAHAFAGHRPGEYDALRPAESRVWQRPLGVDQKLGKFAGEKFRQVANSAFGRLVVKAFNYLKPSTAPRNTGEDRNPNPRGTEPKWADLVRPQLSLSDDDLAWLRSQAGKLTVPPVAQERVDPTIGLYDTRELELIEAAVAVVQGPPILDISAPSRR